MINRHCNWLLFLIISLLPFLALGMDFQEARETGDLLVLYSHISPFGDLIHSEIVPCGEFTDGFYRPGSEFLDIEMSNEIDEWNMNNLIYNGDDYFFSSNDWQRKIESGWESPGLSIEKSDGSVILINLAVLIDDATFTVDHTQFTIKESYDREASDIATGIRHDNMLRAEISKIEIRSHFIIGYRDGLLNIAIAENPISYSSQSLYKTSSMDDDKWIGLSHNNAIALSGNIIGNSLFGSLSISPKNSIASEHLVPGLDGYDLPFMKAISFTGVEYSGGVPSGTVDNYEFGISVDDNVIKTINDPYLAQNIRRFAGSDEISDLAKEILGLDDSGDTDGDGLPDYFELLIASDPLDAYTEDFEFNDYEAYLKKGLLPPVNSRVNMHPDSLPKPKLYVGDVTPNSFMYRAVRRAANTPMAIKFDNFHWVGEQDSAEVTRRRAIQMYIYRRYGEDALVAYEEANRDQPVLMRFVEDWPVWYGETDTDLDGIPDDLEDRGWLFGGLNFDDFGTHYWDRLNALATAFPAGFDGVIIGSYIYYNPDFDFNCISTNSEMFDTDMDGLDDYFEYLWHSCPLLKKSDWSSSACNDHSKVYEHFIAPRPDWIASFQDLDEDGIPNGAEYYFMMEVVGAQLDMYTWSSDWDQYSDVQEWMSWWYKDGSFPYPLDDPLPYVVRNGCHPLIPAYPQVTYNHTKDKLRMPFNSTFSAARGLSGETATSAEIENGLEAGVQFKFGFIPFMATKSHVTYKAKSSTTITSAWNMTSTASYDYSQAQVLNYFTVKNMGTEPTDLNPYGSSYYARAVDVYWPGSTTKFYYEHLILTGADDLPPYMDGESDWGDSRTKIIINTLHDLVGEESTIGDDSPMPDMEVFEGVSYGFSALNFIVSCFISGAPGIGFFVTKVALTLEMITGAMLVSMYFDDDLYREFIDDFEQADNMTVVTKGDVYNTGESGIFSPDNPCDWTSILAAHRNYVTIMCVYPGESDLGNVVKESPINPAGSGADTIFTLGDFIAEYEGTKIEQFHWSDDGADTLAGVGCFLNVWYGDTVDPEHDPACSTLTTFGRWVIISSIDTITESHRTDDIALIGGERLINADLRLAKGDVFILYYMKDSDSDSLEDQLEFVYGTNPYDADTDDDGLGDCFELENGLDPLNPNSDNSFYDALDGQEWLFFSETTEETRVPVGLESGDSIFPSRDSWDEFLFGSPRETDGHEDFVPYPYTAGGYHADEDDQYMDFNLNGVPDWLEKWFQNPSDQWDGRFLIDWDGEQTIERPWGYSNYVFENIKVSSHPSCTTHICERIETDPSDSSGVLEIIFNDDTDSPEMWSNSYIYFKLFNCEIPVTKSMEISYDMMPKNGKGKIVTIDLIFSDGFRSIVVDSFYDAGGARMHPVYRPRESVLIDEWHHVAAPLGIFEGKTIIAIMVGYEDDPNDLEGLVHCWIDNLTIRTKNIILDFAPENDPPDGFLQSNIIENTNVLGPDMTGEPICIERSLPRPYEPLPPAPVADTMLYGPRDSVWEVSGYLDPWTFDDGSEYEYKIAFSIMPESPQYRIDDKTTLGYYIWQEEAPILYWDKADMDIRVPKVVVDLLISTPDMEDTFYMYDYLVSEGIDPMDQFGSSLYPKRRNEMDPDSNFTWRPNTGKFWRYIDFKLPDLLEGYFIEDIIFRYEADQPYAGRFTSYIDNIAIFERSKDVYYHPDARRQVFGSRLMDYYDDNGDTLVDWEVRNIHGVPLSDLYSEYVKEDLSGLLRYSYIGDIPVPLPDSTLPGWIAKFAIDTLGGNTYRYSDSTILDPDIFYTSRINVDTLPIATWDDDGSYIGRIWGYMHNSPNTITDSTLFDPQISCIRIDDVDGGYLKIRTKDADSMKILDVDPAPICNPMCVIMMFEGRVISGSLEIGYEIAHSDSIVWFDDCTGTNWTNYRLSAPAIIDTIIAIWVKAVSGTEVDIDNLALRRGVYHSFEDGEDFSHWSDNYIRDSRNVDTSDDECIKKEWLDGSTDPEPTNGSYEAFSHIDVEGFSPATYKHILFEYFEDSPSLSDMSFTDQSVLMYRIYHTWAAGSAPYSPANAIVDIEYIDYDTGESHWLSEHRLVTMEGNFFTPQECGDAMGEWSDVSLEVPEELEGQYIKRIAIHYDNHDVPGRLTPEIFVDEMIITF